MRNDQYRTQISNELRVGKTSDSVNIVDEDQAIIFGPKIDVKVHDGFVCSFYVSLNVHDEILHNDMLDSRASQNYMLKVIMKRLGLDITITSKELYLFDSSKVKCLGLIKDLVVS